MSFRAAHHRLGAGPPCGACALTTTLLQLHEWDGLTPPKEYLEALDTLVHAGKAGDVGTSNFTASQLMKVLAVSVVYSYQRLISQQIHYTPYSRGAEFELLPVVIGQGLARTSEALWRQAACLASTADIATNQRVPTRSVGQALALRRTSALRHHRRRRRGRPGARCLRRPGDTGLASNPARHHQPGHRGANQASVGGQPRCSAARAHLRRRSAGSSPSPDRTSHYHSGIRSKRPKAASIATRRPTRQILATWR